MKHFKLTFLLIVLLSMVGAKGYAQEYVTIDDIGYQLSGREASLAYGGECSGDLEISGSVTYEGTIYTVTGIDNGAFYECTGLTSVTIPNSVTSIGSSAFIRCTGLTSVIIGDGVTTISGYAFKDCTALTSVTIGNSVTTIGDLAFYGCNSLPSITIPNSVTSIGDYAFRDCTGLTSVIIGDGVTTIGNQAFYGCNNLSSITIPNSVTSIGSSAFSGCTGLTSVTIGDGVMTIGDGAFEECSSLSSITIPNSVTSIGDYAFCGCNSLTSITIPNSVTSIGDEAFNVCNSLTLVAVDLEAPLAIVDWTFSNRDNATLYVPQGSGDAYKGAEYWKEFKEIIELADFTPCATPTISYKDGKLSFECETEGVEFVSNITLAEDKTGAEVVPPMNRKVTVYAKKEGRISSDKAELVIEAPDIKGDVDGDGVVDVNDVQTTINIILKK